MTTPKAKTNNLLYAKLINKKRNQSAIDIEKDLSIMGQQQLALQNNQNQQQILKLSNENQSNNCSFDQDKSIGYFSQQGDAYYGNIDKKSQDNLDYINSLMNSLKQKEIRDNQKKIAMHKRTKSSMGQYSSTPSQQNEANQSQQNNLNMSTNAVRHSDAANSYQNSFELQSKTNRNSNLSSNKLDSKEENQNQPSSQNQIQQKSLSHRSLNETLPIFSKQKQSEKSTDALQKSAHDTSQSDCQKVQGQHNNLSFKIDSGRNSIQKQYSQQQQLNQLNNLESLSANETNQSTGVSVQKTDQAQFLQFLGNYVTYLSQPDESPSYTSSKPSTQAYQNNFFNSQNSQFGSNNNRYLQNSQIQNIQLQNEQLIKENMMYKQTCEKIIGEKKELQYQKNLQQLEISKLMTQKTEDKNKIAQLENIIKQMQQKYNEVVFKLKYTQDNLAKLTIDRENDHYTLKYALQQLQSQQQKNSEMSTFKSNSKNSYSSQNFNYSSKGKESMDELKFDDFENNSHFFSVHNQKYGQQQKMLKPKSHLNFQKVPLSMNRSNFQQEDMYEGEGIHNNTGIFNYSNPKIVGEVNEIEKQNMSIKPQVINQNILNFGQIQDNDQEIEYATDEYLFNQQFDAENQYQQYDMQHSSIIDKQKFINNNNLSQMQQSNKKYHSLHMRNPSNDEKGNISESFYQNYLQNQMIHEINNKSQYPQGEQIITNPKIQKQDIQFKSKGNILKNSSISNSQQSSKINFNSSNLVIPSGDYYHDLSQAELQNNSLSIHQLE
ncbi:hypothetical protein ABPG72_014106 [Tetrahymena utriculariae]